MTTVSRSTQGKKKRQGMNREEKDIAKRYNSVIGALGNGGVSSSDEQNLTAIKGLMETLHPFLLGPQRFEATEQQIKEAMGE